MAPPKNKSGIFVLYELYTFLDFASVAPVLYTVYTNNVMLTWWSYKISYEARQTYE